MFEVMIITYIMPTETAFTMIFRAKPRSMCYLRVYS
jgi:hypothetical protein